MSLTLTYRWEHALIAEVIAEATQSHPTGYLGRTAIQKILYFMSVLGVPMKYSFDIYHYGPFCSSILSDVEWLQADEVITDNAQGSKYSNYRLGKNFAEMRQQFGQKLSQHSSTIREVVKALGDMKPDTLELIATLDFCYRWVSARGGTGPWKELAIAKFKSIKKEKFADEQIDHWYQALIEAKLVKP